MPDITSFAPLWGVWNIVRTLGSGTFGDVYEVRRADMGREYTAAVKHISIPPKGMSYQSLKADGTVTDEASATLYCRDLLDNLIKEIDICYELKGHTNFVSCEDHMIIPRKGEIGFDVLIRMELLNPLPLYISDRGINVGGITKLCEDMCVALSALEQKGIIHRDIKPANIFVNDAGDFKLGDFGVARHMEGAGNMSVKGTYNFMAPEILKGGAVGHNSDIYSLGLVLYRLLNNNRAPFLDPPPKAISFEDNEKALEKRLSGVEIPAPARAELSLSLTNVIMRACEYDPSKRFKTAGEMKTALSGFRAAAIRSPSAAPGDSDATVAVERNAPSGNPRISDFPISGAGISAGSVQYPGGRSSASFNRAGDYRTGPGSGGRPGKKSPSNKIIIAAAAGGVLLITVIIVLILSNGGGTRLPDTAPTFPPAVIPSVTPRPTAPPITAPTRPPASASDVILTPEPTLPPTPAPTVNDSTLGINDFTLPPDQNTGDIFGVRGIISSNYRILSVTVAVYDYRGYAETGKTVWPNDYVYDIREVDFDILFDILTVGAKIYEVAAEDETGMRVLISHSFTVFGR